MPSLYLNTYHPLAVNDGGRRASKRHRLLPFIDGSIRREPDLEHAMPTITCLCRAGNFAPRLAVGDSVVYMTVKRRYGSIKPHRRLTAVLAIERLFGSHREAALWFRQHGHTLPSNLMVPGNRAWPLSHTHHAEKLDDERPGCKPLRGGCGPSQQHREWDAGYKARAAAYSTVVVCRGLFIDLDWTAPVVSDAVLKRVFGTVPGTRNPGRLDPARLPDLLRELGIRTKARHHHT